MKALKAWLLGFAIVGCGGDVNVPPPPEPDAEADAGLDVEPVEAAPDVADDVCHPAKQVCPGFDL